MQGSTVLVRRGHVGSQPRLRLHRVRQGEVGGELRLGTQVEMPAGGSMGMLRPLKGSTWKREECGGHGAQQRIGKARPCGLLPKAKEWLCCSSISRRFNLKKTQQQQIKENKSVKADYKRWF